jgi:hypothetical protein
LFLGFAGFFSSFGVRPVVGIEDFRIWILENFLLIFCSAHPPTPLTGLEAPSPANASLPTNSITPTQIAKIFPSPSKTTNANNTRAPVFNFSPSGGSNSGMIPREPMKLLEIYQGETIGDALSRASMSFGMPNTKSIQYYCPLCLETQGNLIFHFEQEHQDTAEIVHREEKAPNLRSLSPLAEYGL